MGKMGKKDSKAVNYMGKMEHIFTAFASFFPKCNVSLHPCAYHIPNAPRPN